MCYDFLQMCAAALRLKKSTLSHSCDFSVEFKGKSGARKIGQQTTEKEVAAKKIIMQRLGFFQEDPQHFNFELCNRHYAMMVTNFKEKCCHAKVCLFPKHDDKNPMIIGRNSVSLDFSMEYYNLFGQLLPRDSNLCRPCLAVAKKEIDAAKKKTDDQMEVDTADISMMKINFYGCREEFDELDLPNILDENLAFTKNIPQILVQKEDLIFYLNGKYLFTYHTYSTDYKQSLIVF